MAKHWETWRLRHWSARFLTRYQRWWLRQIPKHLAVCRPRHRVKQKLTLLQDCRKHS